MQKEKIFEIYCERFESDSYVFVKRNFSEELTKEEFENFMLEKYPSGEFITIHHLTVFVDSGCYDRVKEKLEKDMDYYLNAATDCKMVLKTLEDLNLQREAILTHQICKKKQR